MSSQPPRRSPKTTNRYGQQQPLPSMATPRHPESSTKIGFFGIVFMMAIFSGVAWLAMVIFGWGPYQREPVPVSANPTSTVTENLVLPLSDTTTPMPIYTETATLVPSATLTSTPTQEVFPFVLDGEPESVPSVMIRPKLGCEWLVIAGQVWDLQGDPLIGLTIHLFGTLKGVEIDTYVLTGATEAIAYGESGYEFALEGMLADSSGTLQIQLVDTNGIPLSLAYSLQTFDDCQQNLILVNFKQVR